MTGDEAVREVGWVARRARQLTHEPYDPAAHVEFFERKAALLDHMASSGTVSPQGRDNAVRLAAEARVKAEQHRAPSRGDGVTTINAPLLERTLQHLEQHPDDLHQAGWRCGSGKCFAGWAAELDGGQWATDAESEFADCLVARPGEDDWLDPHASEQLGFNVIPARERAERVLGLDWQTGVRLFNPHNELDDLRRIVAELVPDEPDGPDDDFEDRRQDVLDDRKWEAFHEAGGHR